LDIAERSGISFPVISEAADMLCQKRLLSVIHNDAGDET
jgi:hypothetical protein